MSDSNLSGGHRRSFPKVGILCLDEENPPFYVKGSLNDPDLFPWETIIARVAGADLNRVLSGDPALRPAFVTAARRLEAEGAGIVISNCGFTVLYHRQIADALSIPVATSSLLLMPTLNLLRKTAQKIGILTFDSHKLGLKHLKAAWPSVSEQALKIVGLEGRPSWQAACELGRYDWARMMKDTEDAVSELIEDTPELGYLLVECAALCSFIPAIKAIMRVPVFDIVSLARLLVDASNPAPVLDPSDPRARLANPLLIP